MREVAARIERSDDLAELERLRAIRDLQGSINPEALPEMAVRLARVRLAKLTPVGNPAQTPGRS